MRLTTRIVLLIGMLLPILVAAQAPSAIAAQTSSDVAIVTTESGQAVYDACYVLVDYSNEGCDENGDGQITFEDVPLGTYSVRQTADLGPNRAVPDFTIQVTGTISADGWERFDASIVSTGGSAAQGDTAPMDIGASGPNGHEIGSQFTVTTLDGAHLGSCTLEGDPAAPLPLSCRVDVPRGTTVVVTVDVTTITPGFAPVENPLYFDTSGNPGAASHWGVFFQIEPVGGSASTGQTSDVAIATTENGQPAYDACYVLVDYSNEGCDENGDGKITFEDVPLGTYSVRQSADLGPDRSVADFTITVTGAASSDGWERFPATIVSTGGGAASGTKDISLITRDPDSGDLLTGACYVLVDYSDEGCDENGDGQVTFDAIPSGTYTVHQTQTPAGYPTINEFPITVDDALQNVPVGYLVKQAPEQNTSGTRNVSLVFVDSPGETKLVPSPICVQIGEVSNVGCDRDLVDGQIDFLDVRTGTHELAFSNLPSGWQVLGGVGPSTINIDAGPGPQIVYIKVLTGNESNSGSGSATTETGAIAVVGGSQTGTSSPGTAPDGTTTTGPAIELILDTSGSMNERDQGNQTRLEVAKTVTTRLVTETLPADVPMALRTYSGCSSSLAIPMQPLDPNAASSTIADLRASGKTPIGQSLRAASADLANVPGPKIIVLVTDGEETCGGDPRADIEALVAQDVNVQVNIVGFAIDDATLTATFQEWARAGNGTYFEASNELELHQAVTTASQLSFRVIDQQGSEVANGTVGGDPVTVPAGTWTVEVDTVPVTRHENVVVTAQQTTTIDLNATGTTDTGGDAVNGSQGDNTQAIVPDDAQGDNAQVIVPQDGAQASTGTSGSSSGTGNLTMYFWSPRDNTPHNSGGCVELVGATEQLCNHDYPDGKIEIVDIPAGTYEVCVTHSTPHFFWARSHGPTSVTITPRSSETIRLDVYLDTDIDEGTLCGFDEKTTGSSGSAITFDSSGSANMPAPGGSTEATLLMTFRGCPEGFDPNTDDFYANCTIPLDAPDASIIAWGGDGQGGMSITGLERQYNGEYVYTAGTNTMNLQLSGLAPVVRDGYQVFGADVVNGDIYTINLTDGETREVFVFYYFT